MKKRNPLKGLADHERKVSSKPVRAKVKLAEKKSESKKEVKTTEKKKVRSKRTNHKSGEINMAEFKRQFKKDRSHLYN